MIGAFATRLAGSSDLYQHAGRAPYNSINFITSHDGFTLNDLVTYRRKHNELNGEGNRDGENQNYSDNYGVEGPTRKAAIRALRSRQIRNMMATLLLSQGVPMTLFGDECRRTQRGNNNAYCQDNALSWFDWKGVQRHADLVRFYRALVAFRRRHSTVRRRHFLTGKTLDDRGVPDVAWFAPDGSPVDWNQPANALIAFFAAPPPEEAPSEHTCDCLILANATGDAVTFRIPESLAALPWRRFVDTQAEPPGDIYPEHDGPPPAESIELIHHSLKVYVASTRK